MMHDMFEYLPRYLIFVLYNYQSSIFFCFVYQVPKPSDISSNATEYTSTHQSLGTVNTLKLSDQSRHSVAPSARHSPCYNFSP